MCNAFAYSLQVYARSSQEMRHFYDFFMISKSTQKEVTCFLKIRRAMLSYLANTTTLDNVNLQLGFISNTYSSRSELIIVDQWSAVLNRIFAEQQKSRDALIQKIKSLHVVLPSQKYPR